MKKLPQPKTASRHAGKTKSAPQPANPAIVSDDRLGSDEPVDEANRSARDANDVQAPDHRLRKIEPDDEHNNENLIEEGMQGYMRGSLTKGRKTT